MNPNPKSFEFTSYKINKEKSAIIFSYEMAFFNAAPIQFSETISFRESFSLENIPAELLENLLQSVHIALGVSYYKLYCPKEIKINSILSQKQAEFWNTVYRKGLGEFFYRNQIDSAGLINFPFEKEKNEKVYRLKRKTRSLVGIGGGKDSIVAVELLREQGDDVTAFLVETQREDSISQNVVSKLEIGSIKIERKLDEKLFGTFEGAYNGHVPISSIFAFLGYLTAILYDYSQVVVANEYSSNFGNIIYEGQEINHQWSKSMEFEKLFQDYTRENICPDVLYFSLLRQFYEIRIMEMFVKYKKYFPIFTSCNRNFRVHKDRPQSLWCGECPKCVFAWILSSAFLEKEELISIFHKNLYDDKNLLPLFKDILGYGEMKPFDCVGTFEESRVALHMAKEKFPDSFIVQNLEEKLGNQDEHKRIVFGTNVAPTLPDKYKLYGVKNVLIVGYGKEGQTTEKYLKKYFPQIAIAVADEKDGENYLDNQNGYDLAIKTPGLQKEKITIPYTTATNLFFSQTKNNLKIGVTGSKGKSTTASLIFVILKEAGKKVRLVGNIGEPMLETLLESLDEEEIFVIELSSYQLDDLHYSPEIAVVTNLFSEHMNYHGSVENYYLAKQNIIKYQNVDNHFIFNAANADLQSWISLAKAKKVAFNEIEIAQIKSSLLGDHNADNIKAAMAVADVLDIPDDIVVSAIEKFQPLLHRMEFVGEFRQIKFYNDANATIPEATIGAIGALPEVETIFLGGLDRGYDFSSLAQIIDASGIKNIVFFPDSGRKIEETLQMINPTKKYNVLHTKDMEEAVRFAYANTGNGKVCLLSTASPSYSIWKNFVEKGEKFKEAIACLK